MAGHSKWANIKHRKARVDAQKGKLFTKLGRELIMAAKAGGGDPDSNSRLKLAIQKAKNANMPADNIQRAIQRGTGEIEGAVYEEIMYEGYGPGGVAVMMRAATDSRNRTAAEVRHIFSRCGGNLGETGCVSWMFDRKGLLVLDTEELGMDRDELMLRAIDAGAEDVREDGGNSIEIITSPESFEEVKDNLSEQGLKFVVEEIIMLPQNTVQIEDKDKAEQIMRLINMLEEQDDIQDVYANYDIPDELMAQLD